MMPSSNGEQGKIHSKRLIGNRLIGNTLIGNRLIGNKDGSRSGRIGRRSSKKQKRPLNLTLNNLQDGTMAL